MTTAAVNTQGERRDSWRDDLFFDVALLVLPAVAVIQIQIIGQVLISDFLVPVLAVMALLSRGLPRDRWALISLVGILIWFTALILADVINHTVPDNLMRGWMRNGLVCFYLLFFMCALRPAKRSYMMAAIGLALCMIAGAVTGQNDILIMLKFGVVPGLLWLTCAYAIRCWSRGRNILVLAMIVVLLGLALVANARSSMTFCLVTIVLMATAFYGHRFIRHLSTPMFVLLLLLGGGFAIGGMTQVYGNLAASGILGTNAQKKYESQSHGGALFSVWNSRPELRVATMVIADNPLLGHGSWYHNEQIAALELLFSDYVPADNNYSGMARSVIEGGGVEAMGHSALLQAWVEAGLPGAVFWFWVISVCLAGMVRQLQHPTALSPMVFIAATELIWDALFSPFGSSQRVANMLELAIILTALSASRNALRRTVMQ